MAWAFIDFLSLPNFLSKVVDTGQRVRMMFHNLKDYSFVLKTFKIGELTNEKNIYSRVTFPK